MTNSTADTTALSSQALQAATFDLWGSRLIEASAGTGKTWTIAALYLRLVLGHGGEHGFERPLRPSEILVMTFTRAATRELSDRIRERLLNAAQCFREEKQVDDGDVFLSTLMAGYAPGPERNRAAWSLAMAAESMDDASVHTIDAWCQRMLKEHAFDSGNLFDEELVADEEAMCIEAAQDYWRQACYPLAAEPLTQLLDIWSGVDAFIADMRELRNQDIPAKAGQGTLAEVLIQATEQRVAALALLKEGWAVRAQTMQDWLNSQLPAKDHGWKTLRKADFEGWLDTLKGWAESDIAESPQKAMGKTAWERLTPSGMEKVRLIGSPSIHLPPEFSQFSELQTALEKLPEIDVAARLHAAATVAQRLRQLKRQTSSFGFADMLQRLNTALLGENGARLRERILAQYPVILIDEFQDTSPLQYQIFDHIYQTEANDRNSALLLIGDPKQSIYGFRGADIYSYMQARRATAGRHYVLETNFRSTKPLVDVVNHWFAHADGVRSEGAFMYRQGEDNPLPFVNVHANGRKEHLVNSQGPVPAMTLVHDLDINNSDGMRKLFAARCAEQIVSWLNDPQAGFAEPGEAGKPDTFKQLRPADIAILVRTGKEAAAVRRELERRSVASVYLSDKDSVFDSVEAQDLVHWLRAVATPQDVRLVRAGLGTRTVGLSLDELGWLASNDDAFDARAEQLRQLRTVWQMQGVLAMLRQTLHQLGLASRWLAAAGGERKLTNFLHLAELLQTASSTLDGEQALIRWLLTEMSEGSAQSDEQVVRLESDADLVKVITIHKSKGLEYPLVCLPYATSFRAKDSKTTSFVNLADVDGQRELLLQFSKDELALADRDRLREDLRLLYVALTRARHALWVGFSAIKTGKSVDCISHKSATGYLLGGTEPIAVAAEWLAPVEQFAASCPDIVLQPAAPTTPCTTLTRARTDIALQDRPNYQANFERNWTIGSFSRLSRELTPVVGLSELSPLQAPRPSDDELDLVAIADAPQVPLQAQMLTNPAPWHKFARGAEAGNFLHDQLEWLTTEGFALAANEPLTARLRRRCERAGRGAQAEAVVSWLTKVVNTTLPGPNAALVDLVHVLPEMEFWLPAHRMEAKEIDAQCRLHLLPGVERPGLAERQLHGMLMGFADLVFEHQGKYWVLDYKSNHLGEDDAAYDSDALANSMAEHRYDVQAAIYLLALHRLLKMRLGNNYLPEQHLGGAVYLFLRGVKGPQNGVCLIPASLPLLDALDAMLVEEALSV
ncbi:MAG: exodeoxyribonuclease V subunit beta [Burkholderiaceae bacterium]|nr:exodeoxyribonuclease V subunit beta [Burkholderiaceae bacterium]